MTAREHLADAKRGRRVVRNVRRPGAFSEVKAPEKVEKSTGRQRRLVAQVTALYMRMHPNGTEEHFRAWLEERKKAWEAQQAQETAT